MGEARSAVKALLHLAAMVPGELMHGLRGHFALEVTSVRTGTFVSHFGTDRNILSVP